MKTIIKHIQYKLSFFNFINKPTSPFINIKLNFYFGDIKHGTPYFLPRKFDKNKKNFKSVKWFYLEFINLGYKTKWDEHDYRFEYPPMISLVILNKQLCIWVLPNIKNLPETLSSFFIIDQYWETRLTYKFATKGKTKDRLTQLFLQHDNTYNVYVDNESFVIDYYPYILKNKWKNFYNSFKTLKHTGEKTWHLEN